MSRWTQCKIVPGPPHLSEIFYHAQATVGETARTTKQARARESSPDFHRSHVLEAGKGQSFEDRAYPSWNVGCYAKRETRYYSANDPGTQVATGVIDAIFPVVCLFLTLYRGCQRFDTLCGVWTDRQQP